MFSMESNVTRYDWISPCKPGDFERKSLLRREQRRIVFVHALWSRYANLSTDLRRSDR